MTRDEIEQVAHREADAAFLRWVNDEPGWFKRQQQAVDRLRRLGESTAADPTDQNELVRRAWWADSAFFERLSAWKEIDDQRFLLTLDKTEREALKERRRSIEPRRHRLDRMRRVSRTVCQRAIA